MEFFTACEEKRPVRLKNSTRKFAKRSLDGVYGREARNTMEVSLNHIVGYENLSPIEKYNAAIYEIVTRAPIRICDGELISGAATLGAAISHSLPAIYKNEKHNYFNGCSHLTADFGEVLKIGMNGIKKKALNALNKHTDPEKLEFIKSCIHCIDCMELWRNRYLAALKDRKDYAEIYNNLVNVPFNAPKNFYEAVQCLWFSFAFTRLCGCWPGIGRIDEMLGDFLKRDLESGVQTVDSAREILAHFFIKGCEWITGSCCYSGDAQHYQNLIISGVNSKGEDVTNEVTYLVLDIIEELGISDFPTTVRINKNTPARLLERVAEVIRHGGGTVAVYNEDLILDALTDFGYPLSEARCFANDGCWEVQIPGKTNFSYAPFDALNILQNTTLRGYSSDVSFDSFEALIEAFEGDLENHISDIFKDRVLSKFKNEAFEWKQDRCCSVISLFEQACIERGLSYKEGGAIYNVISPHIGGLPDVANSLYALKKLVFDEKRLSLGELLQILRDDWSNAEELRIYALNSYKYYGNDNDEVDSIAARLLDRFGDMCLAFNKKTPIKFVAGVSTFGRQIEWAPSRLATPFGRRKGEVLSGNCSPTPGTGCSGAAAIIKSYCKADMKKQITGAALDIELSPTDLKGDNGTRALIGLIRGFIMLGGYYMQINVMSKQTLIEAQKHPENYKALSVRVSGWNARFVTLSKGWQDMMIDRVENPNRP